MNTKETHPYTAADFRRYHEGAMSPLEMRNLEKAALNEPFLSDALDGYFDEQGYDRNKLMSRIAQQQSKIKVQAPPIVLLSRFMAIAAVITGLIFGIWTLSKQEENNKETEALVKKKKNQEVQSPEKNQDTSRKPDSTPLPAKHQDQILLAKNEKPKTDNASTEAHTPVKWPAPQQTNQITEAEAPHPTELMPIMVEQKNRAYSKDNNPLTDTDSAYSLVSTKVNVAKEEEQLSDAVKPTAQSVKKTVTLKIQPTPAGGLDAFYSYMKNGILKELVSNNVQHSSDMPLHLSFFIDSKQHPINVEIMERISPSLKNLIETLLQQGPLWSGDPQSKVELILPLK